MENNLYFKQLNMKVHSDCCINKYFPIPIVVDISKIKNSFYEDTYVSIGMFRESGQINYILDKEERESVFYSNYNMSKTYKTLDFIYDFIEWDLPYDENSTYAELYGVYSIADFYDFCLNSHFLTMQDINFLEVNIVNVISYAKNIFANKLLDIFNFKKEFPKIKLKDNSYEIKDNWIPFMSYDFNMITFQIAAEFPMDIWFTENIGKGFYDWSWREHEAKRIYATQKHRIEDFKETVKSYNIEQSMNSDKK